MDELFRLKISGDRNTKIPQRLLNLLHLGEGDEIRILTSNGLITSAEGRQTAHESQMTPAESARFQRSIESIQSGVHDDVDEMAELLTAPGAFGAGCP